MKTKLTAHRTLFARFVSSFAVLLVVTLFALNAPAQNPVSQSDSFQVYKLSHLSAPEARQQVLNMLKGAGAIEVFADTNAQRLAVRTSDNNQSAVAQLIKQIDRAVVPTQTASPKANATLEAYPISQAMRPTAEQWIAKNSNQPGVRLAIDERTSQLLVYASSSLHQSWKQTARAAASVTPATVAKQKNNPKTDLEVTSDQKVTKNQTVLEPAGNVPAPSAARPAAPSSRSAYRLRTLTPAALHTRLEKLLSKPLAITNDASGEWSQIQLQVNNAPTVGLAIHKTGQVSLSGQAAQTQSWLKVIQTLDQPASQKGDVTQLVSTKQADHKQLRSTLNLLEARGMKSDSPHASTGKSSKGRLVSMLFQNQSQRDNAQDVAQDNTNSNDQQQQPGEEEPDGQTTAIVNPKVAQAEAAIESAGLLGPVQIEFVEGLDIIVLRGSERDVQRVLDVIEKIEQYSTVHPPTIEIHPLQHVSSEAMAPLLQQVYQQVLSARTGSVNITPLVKPNALLLIGSNENVLFAKQLIAKLDQPVEPTSQFRVFALKNASAADAKQLVDEFLSTQNQNGAQGQGNQNNIISLAPLVRVVADSRTNSLIVSAGQRDLLQIQAMIQKIDAATSEAVDVVRVFPLQHTTASELATVLEGAIHTQTTSADGTAQSGGTSGRTSALQFVAIDAMGKRLLRSGILTNLRIVPDTNANAVVITGPADSMSLIEALIKQLDRAPEAQAELKVFTIANGDAGALVSMLETLFSGGGDPQSAGVTAGGNSLVQLQFSVDERTNSIVAAGTIADLEVVEAILLRLDDSDIRKRKNTVYRLKNAFAGDVATALNQWLEGKQAIEDAAPGAVSAYEQIESSVVIVPELNSNSLIVSASPRYYEEVARIINDLDEKPPMVMIQVLIAEVGIGDFDEFGVELGLQDSLLFDRSLLSNIETTNITTTTQQPGGVTVTTQEEIIRGATVEPGFNFGNPNNALGNSGSALSLGTAGNLASQALSSFSVGRINNELGFGGLVLSAGSESVSMLLRALQQSRRLEILSRPQIKAMDSQLGRIFVGEKVPLIRSVDNTEFGQTNTIQPEEVGLTLEVIPRISPDGLVVMDVFAEKSEVGPIDEGIPIFIGVNGQVVRSPRIKVIQARTTVSAMSGQTVVLSGLLTKRSEDIHRSVPLLSDIPLIGDLFRYDAVTEARTELLIIMTPRIVRNEVDDEMLKQVESSRMSWVLSDVVNLHGPSGLRSRDDQWNDSDCEAVYPNMVPDESMFVPYSKDTKTPKPNSQAVQPASYTPVRNATQPTRLPSPK